MIPLLFFMGCPKPPVPPIPPTPIYSCLADPSWITMPHQSMEIPEGETFCDFYQFSWQWFLAQASPAMSFPGERVFETQRVFSKEFGQNQCSQQPQMGRQAALATSAPRFLKPEDFEDQQADGHALYDQNGNILLYNIWYSPQMCAATPQGYQQNTFEIKVSWKKLDTLDPRYFAVETVDAEDKPLYLGMVGMHMSIFTPHHPEMIWVTWEHKDNAPFCGGGSPVQDWSFASKEASACLAEKKNPAECSEYKFNIPDDFTENPPHTWTPTEVCRMYPYGNQAGESVNGNDNMQNLQVINELNEQLVGKEGFLTVLPDDNPMKVWSNYEMIGALWTKDGANSGTLPVDSKLAPADPNSPQRGSLELTNMTMESFEQGSASTVPNCFGCHHYKSKTPLSVSHIESYLFNFQNPK